MSNFFAESEAEESEHEGMDDEEEEIGQYRKVKKEHRKKQIDSSEEEDDDEDDEVVKDLIDDNPIEDEESDNDSGGSGRKRKKSDDEDELDDRLEDEDYDLLEENLGVKLKRKRFKKIRALEEEESDVEETTGRGDEREAIANELFERSDNEEERPSRREEVNEAYQSEESEGEYSDTDDFIVDDEGRPITKRQKRRPIYTDAALQEAQDIFGVDFDFEDMDKEEEEEEYEDGDETDEDEYENEDQQPERRSKKTPRRKKKLKSLYELYEPHELERAGISEEDNKIRMTDVPERMQLRMVPVTPADDDELEEEAEWIFKLAFSKRNFQTEKTKLPPMAAGSVVGGPTQSVSGGSIIGGDNWEPDEWDTQSTRSATTTAVTRKDPTAEEDWEAEDTQSQRPASNAPAKSIVGQPESEWGDDTQSNWDEASVVGGKSTVGGESVVGAKSTASGVVEKSIIEVEEEAKPKIVPMIRKALEFMRNQQLEVPFIANYRKEYIGQELTINDLWTIYQYDARFCQLRTRKQRLCDLYKNMMDYLTDTIMEKPDEPISESLRLISEEDIDRIKSIKNSEELKDMYLLFSLYYSDDVKPMRDAAARRRKAVRAAKAAAAAAEGDDPEDLELEPEQDEASSSKHKVGGGAYTICKKLGIDGLVRKFGLTPEKFAENLGDNYQKHDVEQYMDEPFEAAKEYLSERLKSETEALNAAKFMLATQISREPLVRSSVREVFFEKATIDVFPTKKGLRQIDEGHPCYAMKYIKEKPVRDLKNDQFLQLSLAEEDKLLNVVIGKRLQGITGPDYVEEAKGLFNRDEYTKHVVEWNDLRGECVEYALEKLLFPIFRKELKNKLVEEAKNFIIQSVTTKLEKWLQIAPYSFEFTGEDKQFEEDEDWKIGKGLRVMSIAFTPEKEQVSFAAIIAPDGDPLEFVRLQHISKNVKSFNPVDREDKRSDLEILKVLMAARKPHVIVIGGECRDAIMIRDDLLALVDDLHSNEKDGFPLINVELLDNEMSKVYANSIKAQTDFREYPLMLRQAISLGRRLQDPLIEFAQLVNHDDEILCLRFHPLQDHVSKEEMLDHLTTQFVNVTNTVGVDINRCIAFPYTMSVAQFICGMGRRKSTALIKTLKQNNQRLENRTQLITVCHMGPKIFINSSGFIKIDTNSLGDSTEAYVEVLDSSRVHPETYEWARKMAVDALEYDDDDANPASAMEEILEQPQKLDELNLDAFAEELDRQGFGSKSITLDDIRKELNRRYADRRTPFVKPTQQELFYMLTKETPETISEGKLTTATVIGFSYKKPQGDQMDNAAPIRLSESEPWACSFCKRNDFPDLSDVWNHFDAGDCPGTAIGVRIRLDNGINGFIPIGKLSDQEVFSPDKRVKRGQIIHCRITKLDKDKFWVEGTSRTSDLVDNKNEFKPSKDRSYDPEAEERDKKREEDLKKNKQRQTYVRRVIVHPSFKNISFKELIPMMEHMVQGEVIIRPSSKGSDHLTVSWKVADGVYQHVDVKEEKKENMFSLGQALYIGSDEYEDLDEIIARFVNPMAAHARDIISYRYYSPALEGNRQKAEEYLREEKTKNTNKIHYAFHPSVEIPGKFVLSYMPGSKIQHEFVTVTPDGFRYRQQNFQTLNSMLKWFKEHFRDPPPTVGTPIVTPKTHGGRTPFGTTPGVVDATGKPIPPGFAAHHGATRTTPHYTTPAQAFTPYSAFTTQNSFQPYTPTAQTPYITPYQTPYQSGATPRGSQSQSYQTPYQSGMSQNPRAPNPQQHQPGVFVHPGTLPAGHQYKRPVSMVGNKE